MSATLVQQPVVTMSSAPQPTFVATQQQQQRPVVPARRQNQTEVLECKVLGRNSDNTGSSSAREDSPQNEYIRAINFQSEQPKIYVDGQPANDVDGDKVKNMMSNLMRKVNNSNYLYPGIALMIATLLLIIIIFQATTFISKVLATMIYALFVCVTVYQNMSH